MNNKCPIGLFDSGVGGTSILKEIHRLMPREDLIYLADSKNAPYGQKTRDAIIERCQKNTELLLRKGAKIIVVACNTATTNAIEVLRNNYAVPFIGIEPAIKPAALKSTKKRIGILATEGTLSSRLFVKTSQQYTQGIEVIEVKGNGLVKAIEAGKANHHSTFLLLRKILKPILEKEVDSLVLGCTHYPYLIPQLKQILPPEVAIIDSGKAVARQTQTVLRTSAGLRSSAPQPSLPLFYTNKNPRILQQFVRGIQGSVQFLSF